VEAGVEQVTIVDAQVAANAEPGVYTIKAEVKSGNTVLASSILTLTVKEKKKVSPEAEAAAHHL